MASFHYSSLFLTYLAAILLYSISHAQPSNMSFTSNSTTPAIANQQGAPTEKSFTSNSTTPAIANQQGAPTEKSFTSNCTTPAIANQQGAPTENQIPATVQLRLGLRVMRRLTVSLLHQSYHKKPNSWFSVTS